MGTSGVDGRLRHPNVGRTVFVDLSQGRSLDEEWHFEHAIMSDGANGAAHFIEAAAPIWKFECHRRHSSAVRGAVRMRANGLSRDLNCVVEIGCFSILPPDNGLRVVPVPDAVEFDHECIASLPASTDSVIALATRSIGICGNLDLIPEAVFRLGWSFLLLRLSDLAIASFLSFSHVRTSFR